MKSQKIGCAIIGTGRIGSSLENDSKREKPATHAGAIDAHPDTILTGGCDIDADALDRFAEQWHLPSSAVFSDPERMIATQRPDILHIATPTETHLDLLQLSVAMRVPVVVLEKPVADCYREARRVADSLQDASTRIVVNHERRFSTDYLYVRNQITQQRFGELLSIQGRLYMNKRRPARRVLLHDGTHMIDIIRFLAGGDLQVQAVHGDFNSPDPNAFILFSAGDAGGLIDCSAGRDYLHFELELSFQRGRIRVGNGILSLEHSTPSPYYEHYESLQQLPVPQLGKSGYFINMMDHCVSLLRDPDCRNQSSLHDGLEALRCIEQALSNSSDL